MDLNKAFYLISQKLALWARELVRLLPNILLAAVVLTIGLFVSKWIKSLSLRFIRRFSQHSSLHNLVASVVYVFCIAVTLFTVLSILRLDKAVTSILAGAGIIGLALAFAFQDIASNFISGIFISFRHPIRVGHTVKVRDFLGVVEEINLRDTMIRTFQGQLVIIPNKDVFQNPIENYTMLGKRRYDLPLRVDGTRDLEEIRQTTLSAIRDIDCLSGDEEPSIFFDGVDSGKFRFTVRMWIATPEQALFLRAGSEAILKIKKAYDDAGITLA